MSKLFFISWQDFQKIDSITIQKYKITGSLLMENAGNEMGREIISIIKKKKIHKQVIILCGNGNNGGDGLVIARYLLKNDIPVKIIFLSKKELLSSLSKEKLKLLKVFTSNITFTNNLTIKIQKELLSAGLIVDALFGTGLTRDIKGEYSKLISLCNTIKNVLKIAVDIPSGLTRLIEKEIVFKADFTLTVQFFKDIFLYPFYSKYCGNIIDIKIDFPEAVIKKYRKVVNLINEEISFEKNSYENKFSNGKSLILAGSTTYPGAALLALRSAVETGIQYVTLYSPGLEFDPKIPEAIYKKTLSADYFMEEDIKSLPQKQDNILIGPGIGREHKTTAFVKSILEKEKKKIIIDADGLYHFKKLIKNKNFYSAGNSTIIITPHMGEFSMLMDKPVAIIEKNIFHYLKLYFKKYKTSIILKDVYTYYYNGIDFYLLKKKNSFLAKAGAGDIFSGILLSYISRTNNISVAVNNALLKQSEAAAKASEKYGVASSIKNIYKYL